MWRHCQHQHFYKNDKNKTPQLYHVIIGSLMWTSATGPMWNHLSSVAACCPVGHQRSTCPRSGAQRSHPCPLGPVERLRLHVRKWNLSRLALARARPSYALCQHGDFTHKTTVKSSAYRSRLGAAPCPKAPARLGPVLYFTPKGEFEGSDRLSNQRRAYYYANAALSDSRQQQQQQSRCVVVASRSATNNTVTSSPEKHTLHIDGWSFTLAFVSGKESHFFFCVFFCCCIVFSLPRGCFGAREVPFHSGSELSKSRPASEARLSCVMTRRRRRRARILAGGKIKNVTSPTSPPVVFPWVRVSFGGSRRTWYTVLAA